MSYLGPVLLTSDHIVAGFDCGTPALNEWLFRRALGNQAAGTSRTWVAVEHGTGRVVAFYASSTCSILRSEAPKAYTRNQPEQLPAILLGRLAVDADHTGGGLGAALLKHFMVKATEVAQLVGARLVLVHAKDEVAKGFYLHYGFIASPVDPLALMMLLPTMLT